MRDLADLSLEQLSNIVVTSAAGRPEPLARALASIYVITGDDIRRSGATSIGEALRLAPNLQVAQTGARSFAITARGLNGTLANKLLVLLDGRSIYTPTFSGVFWDQQDVMLEDVDRIEVISGPGGVLWGANAVNGVINILTKSAADTHGTLAAGGAGNWESRLAARHGGETQDGHYRLYAKAWRVENLNRPNGTDAKDGGDRSQAGFRSDWASGRDGYTFQGDVYTARDNTGAQGQDLNGLNVLGRWRREMGGDNLRVQTYFDRAYRQQQQLDTFDIDASHTLKARGVHSFIWGGGYRYARDHIDNSAALAILPSDKSLTNWNVYLNDEIALRQDLAATLGAKIDRNSYTGPEFLPSARLGWRATRSDLVWASWSRAVRTPARFDRDLFLPGSAPFAVAGGPNFRSEVAYVYELGYRGQPDPRLSWSVTGFYHDLKRLRSLSPGPGGATIENDREGHSKGIETWAALRAADWWRLQAGYTHLRTMLRLREGAVDLQPASNFDTDPVDWWNFRSAFDLAAGWQLDLTARHSSSLAGISVPAYTALDVRLGWNVTRELELSLLVRNLLDPGHVEWAPGSEMERGAFFKAAVRF